jgi:hypothetical protein
MTDIILIVLIFDVLSAFGHSGKHHILFSLQGPSAEPLFCISPNNRQLDKQQGFQIDTASEPVYFWSETMQARTKMLTENH